MGIIDTLKDKRRIRARQKEEAKVFRSIIERRNLATRRQAFAKESMKQAEIEGKRKAQLEAQKRAQPTFTQRAGGVARGFLQQSIDPTPRRAPVRRRAPLRRRR